MGLLRADLYKLARHLLFRWIVAILLGLVVLRGLVFPPRADLPWVGLWSFDLIVVALVILAAVCTGLEFSENTFRSLVSRGVPRWGLLASKFSALILTGGLLLLIVEGLATLLGVRPTLNWGELGRAWLALWPYASLVMLLTVLARNGGLALVVGVIWVPLEQAVAAVLGVFAMLADSVPVQFLAPEGLLSKLYRWTLEFNSANWIYLADPLRAPSPKNIEALGSFPSNPVFCPDVGWLSCAGLGRLYLGGLPARSDGGPARGQRATRPVPAPRPPRENAHASPERWATALDR